MSCGPEPTGAARADQHERHGGGLGGQELAEIDRALVRVMKTVEEEHQRALGKSVATSRTPLGHLVPMQSPDASAAGVTAPCFPQGSPTRAARVLRAIKLDPEGDNARVRTKDRPQVRDLRANELPPTCRERV